MFHNNVRENADMNLYQTEQAFTPAEQGFHGILDIRIVELVITLLYSK
jgi:hypothetical protein